MLPIAHQTVETGAMSAQAVITKDTGEYRFEVHYSVILSGIRLFQEFLKTW